MRKLPVIFIIFVILSSCHRADRYSSDLLRAESMIPDNADSALALLDSIPDSILCSEADNALHALLLTHARYKAYIDETDDSLVTIAVDYFTRVNDTRRQAIALFLRGKINTNAGNLSAAVVNLLKAEDAATTVEDNFLLGQIYHLFSIIYTKVLNGPQQIAYAQKAVESFRRVGDMNRSNLSLIDLAIGYLSNCEFSKCISLCDSIISCSDSIRNNVILSHAYISKATSLFALDRYHEAFTTFEKAKEADSGVFDAIAEENMKIAYMKDSLSHNAKNDSLYSYQGSRMFNVIAENGDYRRAYNNLLIEYKDLSKEMWRLAQQNMNLAADEYMKNKLSETVNEKRELKIRLIFSLVVLTLLIIIACLIFAYRIRLLKMGEAKTILDLKRSSEILHSVTEKLYTTRGKVDELFSYRFEIIDKLLDEYYTCRDSSREQRHIYEKVKSIFEDFGAEKQSFKDIIAYVNKYRNGLIDDLKVAFPQMKDSEIAIYVYNVIGLSSRAISILLSDNVENIYNRKSRLKKKLGAKSTREGIEFRSFI